MEYNRAQTIDLYFEKINSGNMEFSDMRKRLEKGNIENSEITIVIRQVDTQLQRFALQKANNELGKNIMYGGLFLSLVGIGITVSTFIGILNLKDTIIFAYGPIGGGLIIASEGWSKMNEK